MGQRRKTSHSADGFTRNYSTQRDTTQPVYYISVVAEMVETHPQTIRMYEKIGLIQPSRTRNNVRLFSDADVEQVRRIQYLTQELGVNLAGVEIIFDLLRKMEAMRTETDGEDST
jgi:MerR family transcriptional regulator/heat shock protein HspR